MHGCGGVGVDCFVDAIGAFVGCLVVLVLSLVVWISVLL